MEQSSAIPPVIDWSQTPLPENDGCYAKVIDDVFSAEECAELLALATSAPPVVSDPNSPLAKLQAQHATPPNPATGKVEWQQASVHYGLGAQQNYVDTDYRNSERILRFDAPVSERIYERLRPMIPELWEIRGTEEDETEGKWWKAVSVRRNETGVWKLVGVNERLSFLHYKPGHYFRAHCDGNQYLPDGRVAHVTIQIYLNGPPHGAAASGQAIPLKGGATRFLSTGGPQRHLDVEPKMGRVLVFQHRRLWHSGEDVIEGEKYALRTDLFFRQTTPGE